MKSKVLKKITIAIIKFLNRIKSIRMHEDPMKEETVNLKA